MRQEGGEPRGGVVGQLFGDEVAGVHRAALDRGRALRAPQRERIVEAADDAARAPQHEQLAGDLLAGGARRAVVLEVDRRRGAVVLARGVDRVGAAEAALVLGERFRLDERQAVGRPTRRASSAGRSAGSPPIIRSGSGAGWIRKNQW